MFSIEKRGNMNEQNVHAALEIADHEIRLAIGQFYNTRLNILKVERVACSGVLGTHINDQKSVVDAILAAKKHIKETLGVELQRVILAIPTLNTSRYAKRIDVKIKEQVTLNDIKAIMKEAYHSDIPTHQELVNVFITKSIVNGIVLRRLPIGEVCDAMSVDVDLLCADRDLVYRYVQTVEKAGLEISEISLDSYAFGKEASLFEKSLETYIVALKIERQSSSLSLFAKGKMSSSEILDLGMKQMISKLSEQACLPIEVADRLLHYNVRFGLESYPDTPVYLWSSDGKTHTLSEKDIFTILKTDVEIWIENIQRAIAPIVEHGETKMILYGESAEINGLDRMISKYCGIDVEYYIPQTLGIRASALSSVAGLFYVLKDQSRLREFESGIDMFEYEHLLQDKKESTEDTFSGKLKGLFERRI